VAKHTDMLSKAIDELLDEYEGVLSKNDMAPMDAKLADDEQGDPLASQDQKGGLQPVAPGQGAPKGGTGNDPVSNGDGAVAKADGSVPPGFKGKDDQKSAGAEDEDAESEAGEDEEPSDDGDEGSEEGSDEGDEQGEGDGDEPDGDEGQGGFGDGDGDEQGEDEDDPQMEAAVEKALYKFMAKIGMTGEMGKGEEIAKSDDLSNLDPVTLEPRIKAAEDLAKAETQTLRKDLTEALAQRDAQISELTNLVKGLSEQIGRLAKAPVSRPRAVQGYAPLAKSEGEGAPINKAQLIDKALGLMKAGKLHDKTLVAKMEMAPPEVAAQLARQAGIE